MAVPKRKHSNARTGSRRSQDHKSPASLISCPECNKMVPSHTICPQCGHYMGRTMVEHDHKG